MFRFSRLGAGVIGVAAASSTLLSQAVKRPSPSATRPVAPATPAQRPARPAPPAPQRPVERGSELVVVATDFRFEAPEQVDAGLVNIRLVNRGKEMHHVLVMKVNRLARLAEIEDALKSNDWSPPWIQALGGPESVLPGGTSSASLMLEPGRYVIACVVASPASHRKHFMDGMIQELAVVSPGRSWFRTALPPAEVTLTLNEWNFELSGPILPGRRTIRVVNLGKREHQVALVRLLPGKSAQEAIRWVENPAGVPPFEMAGGTTGLDARESVNIEGDFVPGEYLLICSLYDPLGRKSHVQMGMIKKLTIGS